MIVSFAYFKFLKTNNNTALNKGLSMIVVRRFSPPISDIKLKNWKIIIILFQYDLGTNLKNIYSIYSSS